MKRKIKKNHAALLLINIAAAASAVALMLSGAAKARSQRFNYAAQRWDSSGGCTQVSAYFAEGSGFCTNNAVDVRNSITSGLLDLGIKSREGSVLVPDAWSAPSGVAAVNCDTTGSCEAEITAVGGEFFMFRSFRLLDGVYFSDSDIMHDGAVIDRNLSWALYGTDKAAGLSIYINGEKFYISGVIDTPGTSAERECTGELPAAYIPYKSGFAGIPQGSQPGSYGVTCYECIIPSPVENYAVNTFNTVLAAYDDKAVVENTGRFDFFRRVKAYKRLSGYAVCDSAVCMPYWENASRITEFSLTRMYTAALVLLCVPLLTAVWLIIKGLRYLKYNKRKIASLIIGRLTYMLKRLRKSPENKS